MQNRIEMYPAQNVGSLHPDPNNTADFLRNSNEITKLLIKPKGRIVFNHESYQSTSILPSKPLIKALRAEHRTYTTGVIICNSSQQDN